MMDWQRARAILLVAFAVVNLVLAYSLWGPEGKLLALAEPSNRVQIEQLRTRLSDRGLVLPPGVVLPTTPSPMRFLRVEYSSNLTFSDPSYELFVGEFPEAPGRRGSYLVHSSIDPETKALVFEPSATGQAAHEVKLDNRTQVRQVAEDYLRNQLYMPADARLSGVFPRDDGMMVEFVPHYQGLPVYSGYIRVDLSTRGVERITLFWANPVGYKEMPPKAVRPAAEALLRLAGHLERTGERARTILDVRLGYYSGPLITAPVSDGLNAWDTVPVWRITLDNGKVYYINAFNGELES